METSSIQSETPFLGHQTFRELVRNRYDSYSQKLPPELLKFAECGFQKVFFFNSWMVPCALAFGNIFSATNFLEDIPNTTPEIYMKTTYIPAFQCFSSRWSGECKHSYWPIITTFLINNSTNKNKFGKATYTMDEDIAFTESVINAFLPCFTPLLESKGVAEVLKFVQKKNAGFLQLLKTELSQMKYRNPHQLGFEEFGREMLFVLFEENKKVGGKKLGSYWTEASKSPDLKTNQGALQLNVDLHCESFLIYYILFVQHGSENMACLHSTRTFRLGKPHFSPSQHSYYREGKWLLLGTFVCHQSYWWWKKSG